MHLNSAPCIATKKSSSLNVARNMALATFFIINATGPKMHSWEKITLYELKCRFSM